MSGELTNKELIQLYDVVMTNINTQFELWLMVTFAVIIASYVTQETLTSHRALESFSNRIAVEEVSFR